MQTIKIALFSIVLTAAASVCCYGQTITGSIGNGTVSRGTAAKATVYLNIPGGLHANSHRPGSEYSIPTNVSASAHLIRIGAVNYPAGHNRKFEFSESTLNVYEGRVPFTFNVTVPQNYKGDSVRINVAVKYQACTNEVCYPPKTKSITLTARVR